MRVQDFRFGYLNLLLFCRLRCRRRHGRCLSYLTVDARTKRGEQQESLSVKKMKRTFIRYWVTISLLLGDTLVLLGTKSNFFSFISTPAEGRIKGAFQN